MRRIIYKTTKMGPNYWSIWTDLLLGSIVELILCVLIKHLFVNKLFMGSGVWVSSAAVSLFQWQPHSGEDLLAWVGRCGLNQPAQQVSAHRPEPRRSSRSSWMCLSRTGPRRDPQNDQHRDLHTFTPLWIHFWLLFCFGSLWPRFLPLPPRRLFLRLEWCHLFEISSCVTEASLDGVNRLLLFVFEITRCNSCDEPFLVFEHFSVSRVRY